MPIPVIPELLTSLLESQYGPETAARIAEGYTHQRPVTLRVNPLKANRAQVEEQLTQAGIAWENVPWYEDAMILRGVREDAVQALPVYELGGVYLQNLSAMLPPLVLMPKAEETILDMAAAPGGKTTQMAALSGNQALITACEKNKIRAERMQFNLQKQGATRVGVMTEDARRLDDLFSFHKILLDAPCSGSGTILLTEGEPQRRMTRDWLNKTAATQTAMLQKALRLLKPGGEMVYSTCSILRMENEDVVSKCIAKANAEVLPIEHEMLRHVPQLPVSIPGTLCVCPDELHEGFFVARIRKKKK